jgi:DNA-binding CsgD family transcriptional regulator
MTRRLGDEGNQELVGDDRNVDEVVERLDAGGSVIVVGALGSGKSHFSRAIVAALRRRGAEPVVVRAAVPLTSTSYGALHANGDPRLAALEHDRAPGDERIVLVVDDAHALDPDSLGLISRAVYTGRVSALLSVTADPAGATECSTPEVITDLWLEGGAARYDLHPLDPRAAELLISAFVGDDLLDTATRSVLIVRAGGSRMLLRELAAEAAAQVAADRDPLDPAFELVPGSRLSDAFSSTLAEYTAEQCLALAVIGRLPGVTLADAARSIRPEVIDALIARTAVHADDSPDKRLHANPLLASEAERRLPAGRLDETLDAIARRALGSSESGSGTPIDQIIAAAWYSSRGTIPQPQDVSNAVRGRVLSSAARIENSRGRADLALAYVRLGMETDGCPPLLIEASRAYARLHRIPEAFQALTEHAANELEPVERRRLVRWWAALVTWAPGEHRFEEIEEWLAAGGVSDSAVQAEITQARAEAACLDMEWEHAIELAAGVLGTPGASSLTRMRAAIATGTALAELGRFDESVKAFAVAEYANRDAITGRPRSTIAELACIAFESIGMMLSGSIRPSLLTRLRRAALVSAQRDDRSALTLADIVAGQLYGVLAQDMARADLELAAALRRFDRVEFGAWRPIVAAFRASALAHRGRVEQAFEVFHGSDDEKMASKRLFRFARQAVEAELLEASGQLSAAEQTARAAVAERGLDGQPGTPSMIDQERLERITRANAASATQERTPGRAGAARAAVAAEHRNRPGFDEVGERREFAETDGGEAAAAARQAGLGTAPAAVFPLPFTADAEPVELTERETEVALLVADHLSNKEIAQRLYLSVRTVESHVYTARGKLGARTRRELGRMVLSASGSATGQVPTSVLTAVQLPDGERGLGR